MRLREMTTMTILQKSVKPILVVALGLLILWAAFNAWLQNIDEEAKHEVASMLPTPTQSQCLDETASRIAKCESSACYGRAVGFGANCLQANKEGREQFCKESLSYSVGPSAPIGREQYCNKYNLKNDGCVAVLDLISSYCSGDFPNDGKKS
jgi:hypothetical protein